MGSKQSHLQTFETNANQRKNDENQLSSNKNQWKIDEIAIKIGLKPWYLIILDKHGNMLVGEDKANTKTFLDVPENDFSSAEFPYITFPFGLHDCNDKTGFVGNFSR